MLGLGDNTLSAGTIQQGPLTLQPIAAPVFSDPISPYAGGGGGNSGSLNCTDASCGDIQPDPNAGSSSTQSCFSLLPGVSCNVIALIGGGLLLLLALGGSRH